MLNFNDILNEIMKVIYKNFNIIFRKNFIINFYYKDKLTKVIEKNELLI